MTIDIFKPAIDGLQKSNENYWGPISFQHYLTVNKLPKKNTAQYISIDSIERLYPTLRENDVMVFRLGASQSEREKGTQFALVKAPLLDFFIEVPDNNKPRTFIPDVGIRDLYAYRLLPTLSERSLVNLAIDSGLLPDALELDSIPSSSAVTGQSTFTFQLKLHSDISKVFTHNKGQVEFDSVFLGRRNSKEALFVVEAKIKRGNIAKHKLIYSILSLAERIPSDIEIVPIFINIEINEMSYIYNILECSLPDPRKRTICVDQLAIISSKSLSISKF